jgi:hypothetical protein
MQGLSQIVGERNSKFVIPTMSLAMRRNPLLSDSAEKVGEYAQAMRHETHPRQKSTAGK